MYLLITALFWIFFYVIFGIAHGHIAKQLEYMKYSVFDSANYWKKQWHFSFAFLRVYLHLVFPLMFISHLPLYKILILFFFGAAIGILFFDSMVNIGRGRGINWHFIGTCEGSWDGDCLWLKIDKYIPHLIVKFLLVVIVLLIYLLT